MPDSTWEIEAAGPDSKKPVRLRAALSGVIRTGWCPFAWLCIDPGGNRNTVHHTEMVPWTALRYRH